MTTIDLVIEKMQSLPLDKQDQVLDFIEFLMVKYQQKNSNKPFIKAASREARALYFITRAKEIHGERYLYDFV